VVAELDVLRFCAGDVTFAEQDDSEPSSPGYLSTPHGRRF